MRHKYIKNTIIENPQSDCVYHLQYNQTQEVIITFTGTTSVNYIDASTLTEKTFNSKTSVPYTLDSIVLFPKDVLPRSFNNTALCPILGWAKREGGFSISTIKYDFKTHLLDITAYPIDIPPSINQEIEENYKKKLTIPIVCGSFPIFYENNRPTYQFLSFLYAQFIRFNNKAKLDFQLKNSHNLCHMRAHFICEFLQHYFNIPTMKLFKYWNEKDWKEFDHDSAWTYHAATVIMDNESRLWVWDPWVGHNVNLLTIEQWLYRTDEPTPIKTMLVNNNVINDIEQGRVPAGVLFMGKMDMLAELDINAFQAVSGDAIPNNPERPILAHNQVMLGLMKHRLFTLPASVKLQQEQDYSCEKKRTAICAP